jgi:hypothetical protein
LFSDFTIFQDREFFSDPLRIVPDARLLLIFFASNGYPRDPIIAIIPSSVRRSSPKDTHYVGIFTHSSFLAIPTEACKRDNVILVIRAEDFTPPTIPAKILVFPHPSQLIRRRKPIVALGKFDDLGPHEDHLICGKRAFSTRAWS